MMSSLMARLADHLLAYLFPAALLLLLLRPSCQKSHVTPSGAPAERAPASNWRLFDGELQISFKLQAN